MNPRTVNRRRLLLGFGAAGSVAALAACGVNTNPLDQTSAAPSSGGSSTGAVGEIIVGSADFTESEILAELYAQALVAKQFTASTKTRIGSREIYLKALQDGSIQAIGEYSGNLLQFLDSGNPAQKAEDIVTALGSAVGPNLTVLQAAEAVDQDVYVVTRQTSQQQGITSLADLAKISATSVLGGPSELKDRPYGPPGLEQIYNAKFKEFKAYDSPAVKVKDLNDNKIQVASFFTTEAAIIDNDYVMLEDPQQMILPQQVIPVVTAALGKDPKVVAVFNSVQAVLTTQALTELNRKVDVDHSDPRTVAAEFLKSKNLA